MYQEVVSYYNIGNGWRVSFQFQGASRVLTVEEAKDLKRKLSWALKEIASQPVIEADAEKPCGTNYDCHYRKAIIHDSRCPKFRAYIQSPGNL